MLKKNQKCWCLYVNLTTNYISFKIEEGKFLGKVKKELNNSMGGLEYYIVEHNDDSVNYIQLDDVYSSEKNAYKGLIKILKKKQMTSIFLKKMHIKD